MADQGRTNRYGRPVNAPAKRHEAGDRRERGEGASRPARRDAGEAPVRRGVQGWRAVRDAAPGADAPRPVSVVRTSREATGRSADRSEGRSDTAGRGRDRSGAAAGAWGDRRDTLERRPAGRGPGRPADGSASSAPREVRSPSRDAQSRRSAKPFDRPSASAYDGGRERPAPRDGAGYQPVVVRERLHPIDYRIQQLGQIFDEVFTWTYPADATLSHWLRAHPQVGARDRAQLAEALYDVLRHLRRYRHYAESGVGPANRRLAILGLLATIGREALEPVLSEEEQGWLQRLEGIDADSLPLAVRQSQPDWLADQFAVLPDAEVLMAALNQAAGLDLRVNPMKADRDEMLAALRKSMPQYDPQPTPFSPWGIRVRGRPALQRSPQFEHGLLEVQDEGSQLLALLLGPKRGEMVIDFCAGAGGKTLLIGALMRSTGRLYAFDVSAARLARAKPRLARSGLSNVATVVIEHENDTRVKRLAGKAQRVLVDAPCSGMGTLRRNPDMKWRQSPQSVRELCDVQSRVLESAARCVAPSGRLVYATCSLLPQENELQIETFLKRHPEFHLVEAGTILAGRVPGLVMADAYLRLRPDVHGTDGFFAAALERRIDPA